MADPENDCKIYSRWIRNILARSSNPCNINLHSSEAKIMTRRAASPGVQPTGVRGEEAKGRAAAQVPTKE